MKIAWHHPHLTCPEPHIYWSGWRSALESHELKEYLPVPSAYRESDGEHDLIMVTPGFLDLNRDCYKKKDGSKTKRVLVMEEDMHHSIETLKCVSEYYNAIFLMSHLNVMSLTGMGIKNSFHMLPAADIRFYGWSDKMPHRNNTIFLGNFDRVFRIQGATRIEYMQDIKKEIPDAFLWARDFGNGFYADTATTLYNDSRTALDLPVMSVVGPRFFQSGVCSCAMILPYDANRSPAFKLSFTVGLDYCEFGSGIESCIKSICYYMENPGEALEMAKRLSCKICKFHRFENRLNQILEQAC